MGDIDSLRNALVDILLDPSLEAKQLPLSLFESITDNFSDERKIGNEGFGQVYKGLLPNEMVVAVKRLNPGALFLDDKSFDAELESMMKLRNKNIVRLLGYCVHTEDIDVIFNGQVVPSLKQERLLCMEFVPQGPIRKAGPSHEQEWEERYQIIKGICNGLDYIHGKGYVHLDLKPDNILLDDDMVPKIVDFGISRCFGDKNTRFTLNLGGGTMGYTAPEYIDDGALSDKADIYSFGVIIFELLTGLKGPMVFQSTEEEREMFVRQTLFYWKPYLELNYEGCALQVASQQLETCLRVGLNCKDHNRHRRRTAKQISHIVDLALDPNILDPKNAMAIMLTKHISSVEDMDLHPCEPWILLCMSSGHIEILNHKTQESLETFPLSDKSVHSAKFAKGNHHWNIIAGDDRGVLHVRDFDGKKLEKYRTITATRGTAIRSVAVHPSERCLLLSTGSSIFIWETEHWTCIRMYHGPSYFTTVTHASFDTNEDRSFGIGCCDGKVKLWSHTALTTTLRPYLVLSDHSEQVCSIDYFTCASATFLVTGSMDKTAKVWKYDHKPSLDYGLASIVEPEATLMHQDGVTATCYVPESKVILTGTNDGVVSVWCAETYTRKRLLYFGLGRIHNLACLMGKRVFIGYDHGLVMVEIDPKQL